MNLVPECMHVRLTSVEMGKLHIEKFLPKGGFFCKELYIGRKAFETTRMQIQIRAFLFGRRRCRSYRWWLLFFRFHTNAGRGRRACLNKKFSLFVDDGNIKMKFASALERTRGEKERGA